MRARHGVPAGYLPHSGGWLRHTTSPRCPERGRRRKPAEAERRLLPRTQQQLPAGPRDCRLPGGRRLSALCPRDGGAKNLSLYLRGRRMQCGTGRRASPAGSAFSPSEVIVSSDSPCPFGGSLSGVGQESAFFAYFAHFLPPLISGLTPDRCLRHISGVRKARFHRQGPATKRRWRGLQCHQHNHLPQNTKKELRPQGCSSFLSSIVLLRRAGRCNRAHS